MRRERARSGLAATSESASSGARAALGAARRAGISLYVHVPFCAARCPYCDFATAPATTALRGRYLDALATEIEREGRSLGRPRLRTIYVGGGTPSLLEPAEIAALSAAIGRAFDRRAREVSFEANPATLDRERLVGWLAFGATRISIGAQSLSERGLRALGRTHQVADIPAAVSAARSSGLAVNLDLIFGWPGQSARDWVGELDAAVALDPDHLSCYPLELSLEPDGSVPNWPGAGWAALERWRRDAAARQADDRGLALLYALAQRRLRHAGFTHYEIANWSRPGRMSLHNLTYWRNGEWLGVGAGAHSHLAGKRSHRTAALGAYIRDVVAGTPPTIDEGADERVDGAMLALRLQRGLDVARFAARFGEGARERLVGDLARLDGRALLRWDGDRVMLTPRGRIMANEVFVQLIP